MPSKISGVQRGALGVLRVVSLLELVSLMLILVNRLTIHSPAITSSAGPLHGLLYVSTILLALLLPLPRSAKWLAVIPGLGGVLALWRARAAAPAGSEASENPEAPPAPVAVRAEVNTGDATGSADRAEVAILADGITADLSSSTRIGPLSFAVSPGGITGVIGPNGAGKTTVLRMLCGLVTPTGGEIEIRSGASAEPAPRMGVLIESPGFIPGLTARENLLVLTRLAGWPRELVEQALERVSLSYAADQRVATFSLGMKQRLGLAAAVLGSPRIVIIDEPTNGLDPRGIVELRAFLRELRGEGVAIVLASHALDEIEELCDHLVAMDRGRVVFTGSPSELLATIPTAIRCRMIEPSAAAVTAAFSRAGHSVETVDDRTVRVAVAQGSGSAGGSGGGSSSAGSSAKSGAGDQSRDENRDRTGPGGVDRSRSELPRPSLAWSGVAARTEPAAETGAELNRLAAEAGIMLSEIAPERPSLEEAFLALTDRAVVGSRIPASPRSECHVSDDASPRPVAGARTRSGVGR